jgi:hypothetical protein
MKPGVMASAEHEIIWGFKGEGAKTLKLTAIYKIK